MEPVPILKYKSAQRARVAELGWEFMQINRIQCQRSLSVSSDFYARLKSLYVHGFNFLETYMK